MNKLLEYCRNNKYSLTLTNSLIDLFNKYSSNTSKEEQENFLDALINTKIVLVESIDEFIKTIKDKLYEEIGYEISNEEVLAIKYMYRQKGIYLPIPNIKTNSVSRTIVVRVSKTNEVITDEDSISLSHEIFHLLRSYDINEVISSTDEVNIKSGVIVTKIPIKNRVLDYFNGTKDNVQCEENFVSFLGEKYSLVYQMNVNNAFNVLHEIVTSGEKFNSILPNEKSEILKTYLNLLLIDKIYNGNVSHCLNSKNADFLKKINELYGNQSEEIFKNIYSREFYDESILNELDVMFTNGSKITNN